MANQYPQLVREVLAAQNKRTVSIIITASGEENTFVFNSEDYNQDTKRIANAMAVGTVQEGHNEYGIATERTEINLTSENGYPTSISDEAPGSDGNAFTQRAIIGNAKTIFETISDADNLDINVVKGRATTANSETKDYKVLLAEINLNRQDAQLPASIGRTLERENSNNPDNKFIQGSSTANTVREKESNVGRVVLQTTLGKYSKIAPTVPNGGSQTGNVSAEGNFLANQDMMQSIGSQITLKAAGEYYVPKNAFNSDEVALARVATLAPGTARLGGLVDFNSTIPSNILESIYPDYNNVSSPELEQFGKTSYGSYNTWLNAYDNINTVASVPGIAIQLGALSLVLTGLAALLKRSDEDLVDFQVGFVTFFGLPRLNNPGSALEFTLSVVQAVTVGRLYRETGWYATTIRSINRLIVDTTVGTGLNIAKNAGDTTSGVEIVASAAFKVFQQLTSGRLIGFIRQLITIGASAKKYNGTNQITYQPGISTNFAPSYINRIEDSYSGATDELQPRANINLSALIKKDRLKRPYGLSQSDKTTLAHGTSTTPSAFIIPNNIKIGAGKVDANGIATISSLRNLGGISVDTPRISKLVVDDLEAKLNSSYMPFYFHDLRTNEVVSFHAFLESSKDGFNVEWNSTTSYGRVEPIHTYKGTTRDINVSFFIVATNKEDHSNMWWKINKLVTMIYPQYTEGRKITTPDGNKFIQPFSQIPGSSPIIRLRLGDVWKTNYSRFNVARLFGLTAGGNNFNVITGSGGFSVNDRYLRAIERWSTLLRNNILVGALSVGDQIIINIPDTVEMTEATYEAENDIFGVSPDSGTTPRASGTGKLYLPRPIAAGPYSLKVTRVILDPIINEGANQFVCEYEVEFVMPPPVVTNNNFILRVPNPNVPSETWESLRNDSRIGSGASVIFLGTDLSAESSFTAADIDLALRVRDTYRSPLNVLTPDEEWLTRFATQKANEEIGASANSTGQERNQIERDAINNFFGENNPIMQAFESTSGQGIAVAFKNLEIDWQDSRWETDWNPSYDSARAPMWVRISMGGTVIHDITPGIDASGFNVAPVYQVGIASTLLGKIDPADVSRRRAQNDKTRDYMALPRVGGGE
jgi:hypothetical protein